MPEEQGKEANLSHQVRNRNSVFSSRKKYFAFYPSPWVSSWVLKMTRVGRNAKRGQTGKF